MLYKNFWLQSAAHCAKQQKVKIQLKEKRITIMKHVLFHDIFLSNKAENVLSSLVYKRWKFTGIYLIF